MAAKPARACLSDTLERQFFHQVYNIWLAQELVTELLDCHWKRCRIQQNLLVLGQKRYQLLNDGLKLW